MDTTSNLKTIRLAGEARFVELMRTGSTTRHYAYLILAIFVFAVLWLVGR